MDFEIIERLMKLLEESDIDELEVEQEGLRVRLQKKGQPLAAPMAMMAHPPVDAPSTSESALPPGIVQIEAPMVGTFYRAPAPDASPYVEVGDAINEDTVVCIVEAMKVMNEIKAGIRGKITDIVVENAQPVEFGQPLFSVKPSSV